MRIFFLYILPILLPAVVYITWLRINIKKSKNIEYKIVPLPLLLITGVILAVVIMMALVFDGGQAGEASYTRAKVENGKVIKGTLEKKEIK